MKPLFINVIVFYAGAAFGLLIAAFFAGGKRGTE